MKLLLTSNGLSNNSIAKALEDLVGKSPKDSKVIFIPTAANADRSNKDWLVNDLYRILQQGYYIDVVDLVAVRKNQLKKALEPADVIFVGGGNTFYLSYWMQQSGLVEFLPELLKTKVYAGISAGSMVAGSNLALDSRAMKNPEAYADKDYDLIGPKGESSGETLKLANLVFRPHLNSRFFSTARKDILENKAKSIKEPVYALDDNSALKMIDGDLEVISEGEWLSFNT